MPAGVPLRASVRLFEDAQRRRLATGEQLRAILQGRDTSWGCHAVDDADAVLEAIRTGADAGPVPLLAALHRRAAEDEASGLALVGAAVEAHPTWPWLEGVRGVGATLAGRLLSRLDIERARTPSSFWSYCGLATTARGTERAAQQWMPEHGRPSYDRAAKQACYLIGVSFMRRGGRYKAYYQEVRASTDLAHPEWPRVRQYLTALRRTEKRFLADLWSVWCEATGRFVPGPHPLDAAPVSPWEMRG